MPDEQEYLQNIGSLSQSTLSRLVYIVGTARGGTTLFHRMVGIHKQILTFPGPSHFINQVWAYRKKVHDRLFTQIFRLPAFYEEETVVKSLGAEGLNELRQLINKRLQSRNLRLMWQLYPIIYALSQRPRLVPSTIKCWVEKETNCSSLNTISKYFPQAKFIFIVRDPRSAVTSLAQRATAKLTASYPTHIDNTKLIDSCIHWRYTMQRILQFSKSHSESCLKVYFEELLMNPESTLNNVYEFIGTDRLPESLIFSQTSELPYKRSNDYSDHMEGQGLNKDAFDRWKNSLTRSELNLIENLTGPTAHKLGYAIGSSQHKISFLKTLMTIKNRKDRFIIGAKLIYISIYEYLV
tara:strand:- start:11105 stop:12160 length:1056 start_codon:yes stop_codon:yes gene_type:complete